jgi:hypothetical protein
MLLVELNSRWSHVAGGRHCLRSQPAAAVWNQPRGTDPIQNTPAEPVQDLHDPDVSGDGTGGAFRTETHDPGRRTERRHPADRVSACARTGREHRAGQLSVGCWHVAREEGRARVDASWLTMGSGTSRNTTHRPDPARDSIGSNTWPGGTSRVRVRRDLGPERCLEPPGPQGPSAFESRPGHHLSSIFASQTSAKGWSLVLHGSFVDDDLELPWRSGGIGRHAGGKRCDRFRSTSSRETLTPGCRIESPYSSAVRCAREVDSSVTSSSIGARSGSVSGAWACSARAGMRATMNSSVPSRARLIPV